jgi:TPR repeat protein
MFESGACAEIPKNDALAAEWFEKAAAHNFKYACYNLAVCYEQGEGVEKDEKKAAEYYERAALQGYVWTERGDSPTLQRAWPPTVVCRWLVVVCLQ